MPDRLLRHVIAFNHWRKQHIPQPTFLLMAAAVVGALGGATASVLKKSTHLVAAGLMHELEGPYKYALYFAFPILGLVLTTVYLKLFIRRHPFRVGITPLIRSVQQERSRLDFHNIYSQVITSAITVGMGGSAGLESPSVASGAAAGSNTGRLFGLKYREVTLLLACGGAAGISGAFDSPVAGMLFAIEVLLPAFTLASITPLLIASAVASVVSWMIYNKPLFVYVADSWTSDGFWIYVLFGLVAGLYTVYYAASDEWIHRILGRIRGRWARIAAGGTILGALVALFPALYGEGYISIQPLLDGDYHSLLANSLFASHQGNAWALIVFAVLTLVGKTVACSLTMGSGGNGGMFGPSVGIGALVGFVFAFTLNQTGLFHLNVTHFMVVGMAASVSGVMHAPLTGIFLSAEITGGYVLMVPLMVVSAMSFFINKGLRTYSIYTKPLARQGIAEQDQGTDADLLARIKLRHVLQQDFVVLAPGDTPNGRKEDIIRSERTVFPVVDGAGKLVGVLGIDELLETIAGTEQVRGNRPVAELVQPVTNLTRIDTPMRAVMQHMDKAGRTVLPVVDRTGRYLGFVTQKAIFANYRGLLIRGG
ncbi:MAG: chloride channel protein [Flavobacteriales bacterium]|nr:chloride channel protein [Flavobacteriales bacterium]MEB2342441.1 chloride channel protein [Flavobacteriia bacterium]